ncbi:uncharacterized protein PHALS_14937 [Plasmopara halstedii]|uniref:Uncharacterized protein n=1 Tax=Plasmopara halstedii TaxID=4781 RepID=A0A0P1AWR0_PLAHL|nr:uncharacterized protein PHALS_14937 [Plasmopara halstedii]CEG46836.1 hypothetical protein PHALS_14937 [Plasmopara halstedii]|eukprot:XP_024583205.1 hypothetical protein PHALS_14937 [Plasmopara halstedii]
MYFLSCFVCNYIKERVYNNFLLFNLPDSVDARFKLFPSGNHISILVALGPIAVDISCGASKFNARYALETSTEYL